MPSKSPVGTHASLELDPFARFELQRIDLAEGLGLADDVVGALRSRLVAE